MSDLKPCPFCGSEAVLNHGHMITATGQYLANVKCSECGIASRVVWSTDGPEEAVKEAIEAWNRRTEPERKWIPVTEALPEEEKDVLVSVHFDGHKSPTVDLPPSDYVEIASHVDGFWSSLSDEYKVVWKKHHVVAWMPLPEPWRGE